MSSAVARSSTFQRLATMELEPAYRNPRVSPTRSSPLAILLKPVSQALKVTISASSCKERNQLKHLFHGIICPTPFCLFSSFPPPSRHPRAPSCYPRVGGDPVLLFVLPFLDAMNAMNASSHLPNFPSSIFSPAVRCGRQRKKSEPGSAAAGRRRSSPDR